MTGAQAPGAAAMSAACGNGREPAQWPALAAPDPASTARQQARSLPAAGDLPSPEGRAAAAAWPAVRRYHGSSHVSA